MSDKISFKVIVAGRTYPLYVQENEVEKIQKAADDINKSIQLLQDNYAVKDIQDLLAMTALQLASKSSKQDVTDYSEIESNLQQILNELD
ncbi:MAG: cell division protein ZapA [Flavobacteriia bacterium]|nr:cell division protein ZapA [Flavobacteriia bacterium]